MYTGEKITIRKKHQCLFCGRVFEVGTVMHCYTSIEGGKAENYYVCVTCQELVNKYPENFENSEGIFEENCVYEEICEHKGIETPEQLLDLFKNA